MPKLGMRPIRRRQLVDAAIETVGEMGFTQAPVSRIAARAGVSPGIVHHYFKDKNDLLEAAMRDMLEQLRQGVVHRLRQARTPEQRLDAIIDGNFASEQFDRSAIAAWLAFWAEAPHNPALARLRRINASRLHSNLRHAVRPLFPGEDPDELASVLAATIDGLWLNAALSPDETDRGKLADSARAFAKRLADRAEKDDANDPKGGAFAWQA